jgi:hypothetical protein
VARRSPQPRPHRRRRRLLIAVIGMGSLVAALEVSAHAVDPSKDVLRPTSGIGPAVVYDKPQAATATTTATTKPAARSQIGSSVVVIIGQPGARSPKTTRPAPSTTEAPAP